MPDPFSLVVLLKTAFTTLGAAGTRLLLMPHALRFLDSFRNPHTEAELRYQRAVEQTCRQHPHCAQAVRQSLEMWNRSATFEGVYQDLIQDQKSILELAQDFLNHPSLQHTLEERDNPQQVAADFLCNLLEIHLADERIGVLVRTSRSDTQHANTQEMIAETQLEQRGVREEIRALREEVVRLNLATPQAPVGTGEAEISLQHVFDLIQSERLTSALQELERFDQKHGRTLTAELAARYHRLLASTHAGLHHWEAAREAHLQAFTFDSASKEAQMGRAYADYLAGHWDAASQTLSKLLATEPRHDQALSLQVELLVHLGRTEDLLTLIPLADQDHTLLANALFKRLLALDLYPQARQVLTVQREHHPTSSHWMHMEARLLFEETAQHLQEEGHFTPEHEARMHEALDLLNAALTGFREKDRQRSMREVLHTRIGVRILLEQPEAALQDCLVGLHQEPGNAHLLASQADVLLRLNRPAEAQRVLDQLPEGAYPLDKLRLSLRLHQQTGNPHGQLEVIEPYLQLTRDDPDVQAHLHMVKSNALLSTAGLEHALQHLAGVQLSHPLVEVARGDLHELKGDLVKAEHHFQLAHHHPANRQPERTLGRLAGFYEQHGQLLKAIETLEDHMGENPPVRFLQALVYWTLDTGQLEKCRYCLERYRATGHALPPGLVHVDAHLHLRNENFDAAILLIEHLLLGHFLLPLEEQLAHALYHGGHHQRLPEVLNRIENHPEVTTDALFRVSRMWSDLQDADRSMEAAYRAYRQSHKTTEDANTFVGLGVTHLSGRFMPSTVQAETAVHYTDGEHQHWVVFTADPNPVPPEVPLEHALFQQLQGKTTGDTFTLPVMGTPRQYTIGAIWPKADFLLHTLLNDEDPVRAQGRSWVMMKFDEPAAQAPVTASRVNSTAMLPGPARMNDFTDWVRRTYGLADSQGPA